VAHAIQQRRGAAAQASGLARSDGLSPKKRARLEYEAEAAGRAFARGERFEVRGRAPLAAALYRGKAAVPAPNKPITPKAGPSLLKGASITADSGSAEVHSDMEVTYHANLGSTPLPDGFDASYEWSYVTDSESVTRLGAVPRMQGPTSADWAVRWPVGGKHTLLCAVHVFRKGEDPQTAPAENLFFEQQVRQIDYRLTASPKLAVAVPGSKVTYSVGTHGPASLWSSMSRYRFRWKCINDPKEAKARGKPAEEAPSLWHDLYRFSTKAQWEKTWELPGTHTIVVEVEHLDHGEPVELRWRQVVATRESQLAPALKDAHAESFATFKIGLDPKAAAAAPEPPKPHPNPTSRSPALGIRASGNKVAVVGHDPAEETLTVIPRSTAATVGPPPAGYRWFVRIKGITGGTYHGHEIDAVPRELGALGHRTAINLGVRDSVRWPVADAGVYTFTCFEVDKAGHPIALDGQLVQGSYTLTVETPAQAEARAAAGDQIYANQPKVLVLGETPLDITYSIAPGAPRAAAVPRRPSATTTGWSCAETGR
jgi:hypothetical protein